MVKKKRNSLFPYSHSIIRDKLTVEQWTKENVKSKEAKAILDWFVRVCLVNV
jgi:hypothetical protein